MQLSAFYPKFNHLNSIELKKLFVVGTLNPFTQSPTSLKCTNQYYFKLIPKIAIYTLLPFLVCYFPPKTHLINYFPLHFIAGKKTKQNLEHN